MFEKNRVYQKSAKGTEAIAKRQHGLNPKQRSMLIMVDGRRGFDELVKLSQLLGDTEELLSQLLAEGCIEVGATGAAPAPAQHAGPAPSASAPLTAAGEPFALAKAQRFVSRRLIDMLGPNADELCLRIEAARTPQEFQVAVTRAEGMLRQFKSAQAAAAFSAEIQPHMPS